MRKVLVTGASGFIGSNLILRLISRGDMVYAFVRNIDKALCTFDNKVTIIVGDITDFKKLTLAMNKCDLVFHCAAFITFNKKDYSLAYKVNVEGTRNVLEAAYQAGVKKVVHLSACAVLGFAKDKNKIIDESANPVIRSDNVYAFTKKLAEEEVQKYVMQKGLDVSIANIATVYGQGDRKLNSGSIIKAIFEKKLKFIPPGGTSFVSIDDLVDGLILLSEYGRPGERYIFCTENIEYKELVQKIAETLGVDGPKFTFPVFFYYPAFLIVKILELILTFKKENNILVSPQILKETFGYKYFDSQKARKELGWQPCVELSDAVKKAVDFYRKHGLM
jgi:dihydroflavonol-4-reductase